MLWIALFIKTVLLLSAGFVIRNAQTHTATGHTYTSFSRYMHCTSFPAGRPNFDEVPRTTDKAERACCIEHFLCPLTLEPACPPRYSRQQNQQQICEGDTSFHTNIHGNKPTVNDLHTAWRFAGKSLLSFNEGLVNTNLLTCRTIAMLLRRTVHRNTLCNTRPVVGSNRMSNYYTSQRTFQPQDWITVSIATCWKYIRRASCRF